MLKKMLFFVFPSLVLAGCAGQNVTTVSKNDALEESLIYENSSFTGNACFPSNGDSPCDYSTAGVDIWHMVESMPGNKPISCEGSIAGMSGDVKVLYGNDFYDTPKYGFFTVIYKDIVVARGVLYHETAVEFDAEPGSTYESLHHTISMTDSGILCVHDSRSES